MVEARTGGYDETWGLEKPGKKKIQGVNVLSQNYLLVRGSFTNPHRFAVIFECVPAIISPHAPIVFATLKGTVSWPWAGWFRAKKIVTVTGIT